MRITPINRYLLALIPLVFFLCAMGSGPTKIISKVPQPDRPFSVTIHDVAGRDYQVQKFSVDGVTFLPVKMGKAQLGIDFQRILELKVLHPDQAYEAKIRFRDGGHKQVALEPTLVFSGQSKWGPIRLQLKDIYNLKFQ